MVFRTGSEVRSARPSIDPPSELRLEIDPTGRTLTDLAKRLRTYPFGSSTETSSVEITRSGGSQGPPFFSRRGRQ